MAHFEERKNKSGDTVWKVQVFCGYGPDGKQIMVSRTSKSPRKKDAQKLAAELLLQHGRGELVTEKKISVGTLLDDLVLDYRINGKDMPFVEGAVRRLRPFFGAVRPDQVGTPLLKQYVAKRQAQGRANATINNELAMLRRAMNLGAECTPPKCGRVPKFPMMRLDNVRLGFLEHPEYQALFLALPEELRPVLAFAYYTATRRGEILSLKWSQVDLTQKVIRLEVGSTKNKEGRTIPLVPELLQPLAIQKALRDGYWPACEWVFFHHYSGKPIGDFRKTWAKACYAAGLWEGDAKTGHPTRLFHDLRRTGVRNLIRAGTPETVAMKISGHRTRSVFDRYNVTSERDLMDAAERLSRYLATKDQPPAPTETSTNLQHDGETGLVQ